ncbi:MAG: hypothetical protein ACFE96_00610 [Candidatus Hermodarchaeota archaeon]
MNKRKSILILVICSLVPLLFTTVIPFTTHRRIDIDSSLSNQHGWTGDQKLYVIALESGSEYTIIMFSGPWDMDVSIRIGETPYMINGVFVDSGSTQGETMHFTPSKSGDHYIQIKVKSGSGFFYFVVESGITDPATGTNEAFLDVSYLLVLILPSVFVIAIGALILKRRASRPEKKPFINIYRKEYWTKKAPSVSKEELVICEHCGVEFPKNIKKCPNCQKSLN